MQVYLFKGNMLVTRPCYRCYDSIPLENIRDSFGDIDLFSLPSLCGDTPLVIAELKPDCHLPDDWIEVAPRQALFSMVEGKAEGIELLRAFHIAQWRRESAFCGSCGNKNLDDPTELARVCPHCARREYPRIAPAMIVLITNDEGKALLAHNRNFTAGMYSLISGFNDAGESLEQTVIREVWEEVSLEIKDLRYVNSQPWPFPHSLMLGFTARHAGGNISVDGVEIEDARWFDRDNLPLIPNVGSLSRYLINLWLEGKIV